MTHERDLERLLDVWFDDGPASAPDRVVDIVTDRIGRQAQRPVWRLDWRRYAMNTNVKIAAALVAVIAIAVVGYNLLPGTSPGIGGPAPSATPTLPTVPSPTLAARPWWLAGTDGPCGEARVPYGCAGELAAGTHTSGGFHPAVTLTVPAGWVIVRDWADYFSIFPDTPETRADLLPGADPSLDVLVLDLQSPGMSCDASPVPIDVSVADLVAEMAALWGATGDGGSVTIGGLPGQWFDVLASPEYPVPCAGATSSPVPPNGGRYRVILLDTVGPGSIGIQIRAANAADFDRFLADAMPVVESMEFDLTP
jgi:hypothetical protein